MIAKIVAFVIVAGIICLGLWFTIYFYSHMSELCQQPFIGWEKECIGYNLQHH